MPKHQPSGQRKNSDLLSVMVLLPISSEPPWLSSDWSQGSVKPVQSVGNFLQDKERPRPRTCTGGLAS